MARFHPLLVRNLQLKTRGVNFGDADALDLANEVWGVVIQKLASLEPRNGRYTSVLHAYLGKCASFVANNAIRRHWRRAHKHGPPSTFDDGVDGLARTPDPQIQDVLELVMRDDVHRQLERLLATLTDLEYDVITLRICDRASMATVAAALGVTRGEAHSAYRRALRLLRAHTETGLFAALREVFARA